VKRTKHLQDLSAKAPKMEDYRKRTEAVRQKTILEERQKSGSGTQTKSKARSRSPTPRTKNK
jgi:hypothetical protein